jgi:hypothetical protein
MRIFLLSSYADWFVHNDKSLDLDAPIVDDLVEIREVNSGGGGGRANELRFLMLTKMNMEMPLMRMKMV